MRCKTKYDRVKSLFLLVLLLIISPILWAATDEKKDIKPSTDNIYTIKNGDTLWDISATYLKNPFLWPKIWEENKYISDPDLIYPGNRLNVPSMLKAEEVTPIVKPEEKATEKTITEKAEERPSPASAVEAGKEEAATSKEKEAPLHPETEKREMVLEEEMVLPEKAIAPLKSEKEAISQITPEVTKGGGEILSVDYIIADSIDGGVIIGSKDNRNLLGKMDRVYIKTPNGEAPRVGDSYTVIRRIKKVTHPKTGRSIGNLIRVLGILRVVDVSEGLVTADIIRSADSISKGDRLIPYKLSFEAPIDAVPEKTKLRGYIVETSNDKTVAGQFDIVYIDKGRKDGVSSGDIFLIYREGNKTSGYFQAEEPISTDIAVGRLKILSAQENTSTAEVARSSDTIEKGYIVEKVVE